MEIGDLDKEESMEYLVEKRSIKEEDAKKLYDLVGGRIVELNTVADDFLAGQTFEGKINFIFASNEFAWFFFLLITYLFFCSH